ncbi:MAG TPA: bifunctional diguanylate cyclase/phosphodiesterase [Pseudonocardiaceae bacterium]|jgi:diguanylate cyclase (GGDEF)-like protein|nr:bifunctional diguanylate cyclase/phosphodiesterase [Pseudonocardiaceae bacterium]
MTERSNTPARDGAMLDDLARSWARAVARSSFLVDGQGAARVVLGEALRTLLDAVTTEPFDPGTGRVVGHDLVAKHISSPRALGDSIDLLGARLLPDVGRDTAANRQRLAALLGQLATGYTEALRDAALTAAENINRAERTAWRDQQRRFQQRLQHALLHDQLTGLPNRAQFTAWLGDVLAEAPEGARLGVCLISIDRFRAINDSIGMDRADEVLLAVSTRLAAQVGRNGHFLARLGGDTFAVGVERTGDSDDVAKVADRALRTLADPIRLDGLQIPVTASAGIVEREAFGATATELIRAADISAGWARTDQEVQRRGGRWAVFDPERNAAEVRRHTLTAQIPAALDNDEFGLVYQPLLRLSDHSLSGVEALARWHHPEHGIVGPGQFIPAAEDTGLIVPLGMALLEQACRQAARWRASTGRAVTMSVNLAAAQIRTPGLVGAITDILDRTRWPAELLQLEITESVFLDGHDDVEEGTGAVLRDLARLGIGVAIDDFGTGYSSFAYLAGLPVTNLKLAASFLRGLDRPTPTARSNRTILPALVALGHELDVTVTAEGIETADQADHLKRLGCDFGQGYHFSRPVPSDEIASLLG